jgi:ribulose-5-phosphate 4-epimerase/fuculose-1-phosphate aldolase
MRQDGLARRHSFRVLMQPHGRDRAPGCLPYFPPGDLDLAKAVREMASKHHAVLLANHGPVVAGKSLEDAVFATEELEETAKLFLLLKDTETRFLTHEQVTALRKML